MTYNSVLLIIYIAWLVIMSLAAIVLYSKDKAIAKSNGSGMRIQEKTLLSVGVLGGAIGSFFGRLLAHHKTDKTYFSIVIYLSMLLQIGALVVLIVMAV